MSVINYALQFKIQHLKFKIYNDQTMRTIILSTILLLSGCMSTTKNLGEPFTVKTPVTVDALLTQLGTTDPINDIQVEGKVEKSCMSEGCWFTIKDGKGNEVLFNVKDKKFRVPVNSPGMHVVVLADASRDSSSQQKALLSVRGMRFQ